MSNEKTPQEKKKLLIYLMASAGFVAFILFCMTVYDIATRSDKKSNSTAKTEERVTPTTSVQSPEQFEQLVQKQTSSNSQVNYQDNDPDLNESKPTQEELEIAKARLKYKLAELDRGLASTRSRWLTQSHFSNQTKTQQSSESATKSKIESLEQQRDLTEQRIEQVRRLKAELDKNGGYAVPGDKLEKIQSQFSPPPPDIAGFTRSNKYNADVEGKIKLPIGTVIPVITTTKSVSDYTGVFKGIVTQDIYDVLYQYVLVPKGSEVIMKSMRITNVNEPIQARMGIVVQWVILPDGNKIDMTKSSGLDREGVGAIKDEVDYHAMSQFLGVAAYAVLSANTSYEGSGANNDSSYEGEVGDALRQQAAPIAQRYLSLTPTITIKAGQSMNIITEDELYLNPWKSVYKDYD